MSAIPKGRALVTGAARRLGRAIALDLGRSGWAVAVHYKASAREAEAVVSEIGRAGGRAVALQADLAREAEVCALVPRAREALGPLTCLVNNASVFEEDRPETVTRETWDRHMAVNLRAPFLLCQAFAAQFASEAAEGQSGNVINVLDQRVWNLTPHFTSYTLSKSGLWTLTRTLALAFAPGIRVNAIGPGPTLANRRQSPEHFVQQQARTPLGRGPTLEEICAAVRFVLGAASMTGQMIALDGGQHLDWSPVAGHDPAVE